MFTFSQDQFKTTAVGLRIILASKSLQRVTPIERKLPFCFRNKGIPSTRDLIPSQALTRELSY